MRRHRSEKGVPRLARRVLRAMLAKRGAEEIEGVLEELYHLRAREVGRSRATWWYRRQFLGFALRRRPRGLVALYRNADPQWDAPTPGGSESRRGPAGGGGALRSAR